MHAVSWLVISGAWPLLSPGMHPSAMTHRLRPIGSDVTALMCAAYPPRHGAIHAGWSDV